MLEELSEGLAEREHFAQIIGIEIRTGVTETPTFAADLDNADNLVARKDGRANHLLDDLRGLTADFYALENGGVANAGKIVDDVRTALTSSARGNRGGAGKRNETDLLQRFRHEEVQVAPARRDAH